MSRNFKIIELKNIRNGVFETNSSSNHSIIISDSFEKKTLREELDDYRSLNGMVAEISNLDDEDFYIPVFLDSTFGQSGEIFNNTFYKITYTLCAINRDVLEREYNFSEIIKKNIPNFKGFVYVSNSIYDLDFKNTCFSRRFTKYDIGELDHQSYGMIDYLVSSGIENLEDILFNNTYSFHLGSDWSDFTDEFPDLNFIRKHESSQIPYLMDSYENGNYLVRIYSDGSKLRYTKPGEELQPEFPESIDLKISNACPYNCKFCHERSSDANYEAAYDERLLDFAETLHQGTEIALGGGAITKIPSEKLFKLLKIFSEKSIIVNVTINWREIDDFEKLLIEIRKEKGFRFYFNGVGVSITGAPESEFDKIVDFVDRHYGVVLHAINGLVTFNDLRKIGDIIKNKNTIGKLLILGYKDFGRGVDYFLNNFENIIQNQVELKEKLDILRNYYEIISFDSLAVEQLEAKNIISDLEWRLFYLGGDGETTMYIDGTNMTYGINSISTERFTINANDNIEAVFRKVRENVHK